MPLIRGACQNGLPRLRVNLAKLADEIADTFIYLDLLAQRAGIKLSEAVPAKFDKTSAKRGYPLRLPESVKKASEA